MERIRQGLNRIFHGSKRQMITAASALFIVYVLLLSGIFSYFHSEDSVVNRLTSPQGSVTINEPKWDGVGQYMAQAAEPGMEIPKDPKGCNNGSVDVYIRLKMTVETVDQAYYDTHCSLPDTADTDNGEVRKKTEAERLTAIVNAIRYIDGSNAAVQFLTLNDSLAISDCANSSFYAVPENQSTDNNKLTYYFYYTAGDKDSSSTPLMHRVAPEQYTDELFQRVDIPKFKKDYLGVFDFDFNITLTAEAIPVGDDAVLTVNDAIGEFD